ncbi:polysaccharide biosynthesis/export family protein [Yoonia sediminilitoris]|uniref:Polysaccharide export outer membrane protein n=1 Tax=Yoonia sediminilitoris TaxID=1286148 RepID=A0A2T6KH65_9RHOB|nr:polysaccharide biosynthesis/export family protein [Yoonia sediminilitoris]PUB14848.1 polysaccharide export outer membrane protein [Yoonia sediminilitoris]RCW95565.1 polysaccharide export outer membrane protein [Yoonia sediminilitoris]
MLPLFRNLLAFACVSSLASCGIPRGAGFQSEVLAASSVRQDDGSVEQVYDFAVFEVTKATLPQLQSWPDKDKQRYRWVSDTQPETALLISPGDKLQLTVWDAEENSLLAGAGQRVTQLQEIEVSSAGRIFVPYIGELKVSGMSSNTARARIEEQLNLTIPSAQVQLNLLPGRVNTVNVVTGVAAPGIYPLGSRNTKLLDLLSEAGSVPSTLVNPMVRLSRGKDVYGIAYSRLLENPSLDTTVRGGDRIFVEEDKRTFLSLGTTGSQAIHPFPTEEVTALDAMAIVGGVNPGRANPEGILILREYDSLTVREDGAGPPQERVVFTLDLTSADGLFSAAQFRIQPDDLVYGTESVLGPAFTLLNVFNTISTVTQ